MTDVALGADNGHTDTGGSMFDDDFELEDDWDEEPAGPDPMACARCGKPERAWRHFLAHTYRSPKIGKQKGKVRH